MIMDGEINAYVNKNPSGSLIRTERGVSDNIHI